MLAKPAAVAELAAELGLGEASLRGRVRVRGRGRVGRASGARAGRGEPSLYP